MLISIQNLGCSKNQVDGERILQFFVNGGYEITEDHCAADVIIVNTCAFIKEAQEEAIAAILDMAALRQNGRCRTLIVSGCFSERYRSTVNHEFPEVDIWAGVEDWEKSLSHLIKNKPANNENHLHFERALSEPIATQYIKIAEGCSHSCSFCVIPAIRGKFKSRNQTDIIEEAQWLYEKGARELILVAQDTSFYGRDINTNLITLLETLLKNTRFQWIRMMYLHPQLVSDDLLTLISSEKRLCPYFDIPLQHISGSILKSMNRLPLSKELYHLVERIKSKVSGATLRSSFILGYPGETEKQFDELKQFIQYARFHKMGVFPFSPEEGTKAYDMRPRPRGTTVQRRSDELMSIQQEISREHLEEKIGTRQQIIIDRVSDDHDFNYEGRTMGDAPEVDGRVFIQSGNCEPGEIVTAKIIGASDYDLYAALI